MASISTIFRFFRKNGITYKRASEVHKNKYKVENILKLHRYLSVVHSMNLIALNFMMKLQLSPDTRLFHSWEEVLKV